MFWLHQTPLNFLQYKEAVLAVVFCKKVAALRSLRSYLGAVTLSTEEKEDFEHSSICLWLYFWISQPLVPPIHLTNWEKQVYSDAEMSQFDADVSLVMQMSLSFSFAATTFPVPHLAIHSLAVSKVTSATVQPWKYGAGFFRCSHTWTNSPWQHLNPLFRLISCLSSCKYFQNREFGPNISEDLQSLYVWGSGAICRYLKIF